MSRLRSLFGIPTKFGTNATNPIDGFIEGMARQQGLPIEDRAAMARKRSEGMQKEQQAAYEAGMKAKAAADAQAAAEGKPVEVPGSGSFDEYMGKQAEQAPPEDLPTGKNEQPKSLFGDGPMELPTPPPDPVETGTAEALDYVDQFENMPLNQEGQTGLIRLKKFAEQIQSDDYLPEQKQELISQFQKERDRLRLEKKVQPPPTVDSESMTRVSQAPNGMQTILQPDGRIDTKDPTTKAELEQIKLQQAQQQHQTQIEQLRLKADTERKAMREQERTAKVAEEKAKQQKVLEDRRKRHTEFFQKALKEKPMSDRYGEAKKELEAAYKAQNPKLPMRAFSEKEVSAYAEGKMNMDFMAQDRLMNPSEHMEAPKITPEERLRTMAKEDPAAFNESIKEKMQELRTDPEFAGTEPKRADAIKALMKETPEALMDELESVLTGEPQSQNQMLAGTMATPGQVAGSPLAGMFGMGPSGADAFADGSMATPEDIAASPLAGMFGGEQQGSAGPSPVNPLRLDRETLAREVAAQNGVDPSEVGQDEIESLAKAKVDQRRSEALKSVVDQNRSSSEAIKQAESLLKDRQGRPMSLADVLDADTIEALQQTGSQNPVDDAAKAISEAIQTGARNVNLYPPMMREGVKRAFPLVTDESDEGLDRAGVVVGMRFRDPYGNIKERTADEVPEKKTETQKQTKFGRDNPNAKVAPKVQTKFGRAVKKDGE